MPAVIGSIAIIRTFGIVHKLVMTFFSDDLLSFVNRCEIFTMRRYSGVTISEDTMTFIYSRHKTRQAALDALEDYFASGEVSQCEVSGIQCINGRYCVMLWG